VTNIAYAGDNGTTPGETFSFDPSGRQVSVTSTLFGAEQRTYDADGRLLTVAEPTGGGLTDPATLRYSYYPNGTKSALSVSSRTFTQPNAITYSYRSDSMLQTQSVNAFQSGTWNKTYTAGGRLQSIAGVDHQSRAYDSTGQLATYTLAGTTIAYPAHDPEGSVETVVFPNVSSGSFMAPLFLTETLTNVVNLRGELVDQSFSPNPNYTYPAHHSTTNSGYRDTRAYSQDPNQVPAQSDSGTDIDFLNGIAFDSWSNGDSSAPDYRNTRSTFTFDTGGRQIRSSETTDSATTFIDDMGVSHLNRSHVDNETVKTYDAENHTQSSHQATTSASNGTPLAPIDHGISTIGWGPNGHPVQVLNDQGSGVPYTLHWDGDALLFVSDAAGNVVDFKVGTDGGTAPGNTGGVTVYDRDTAGVVLLTSNASGHSALAPLDSSDLSGPSYPGTNGYQAPPRIFFDTNRADGYNFGSFRINGVRAFDAALGSWTTPDAYAGDVHDPASQQRYMWNRNNPYEYSDPSGYESQRGWYDTPTGLPVLHNSPYDAEVIRQITNLVFDMLTDIIAVADGVAEMRGGLPSMTAMSMRAGKAPEFAGGTVTESGFLRTSLTFLGKGPTEVSPGRYVSADGLRQVRFGVHETRAGKQVHAHYEAYDKPVQQGGRVIETRTVMVVPDGR
ncbi:MAG TPA: hypothetical protein VGU66_01025, partial [Candidatus Elarobacter sp.]|nr:hypothetical protein [Candidatus Elarobacter sp.]